MKSLLILLCALAVSSISVAQPPQGPANKGMTFGKSIDTVGSVRINELLSKVGSEDASVKVKGKVIDVCTKEGCWLKMETHQGSMMVKMRDHSFLVPVDIKGKEVVVEGIAKVKITPVKELQHYAEDAGKTKEEIAAINQPKKEIVVNADGILVL